MIPWLTLSCLQGILLVWSLSLPVGSSLALDAPFISFSCVYKRDRDIGGKLECAGGPQYATNDIDVRDLLGMFGLPDDVPAPMTPEHAVSVAMVIKHVAQAWHHGKKVPLPIDESMQTHERACKLDGDDFFRLLLGSGGVVTK
ncbi:hypothetical protein F4778DRAFT_752419 [Xylariomycetidae sp. FL2044]|nr:hypothetical protein F4778DRAFT_752419 [Xylariomycetidae sp. FL2044]